MCEVWSCMEGVRVKDREQKILFNEIIDKLEKELREAYFRAPVFYSGKLNLKNAYLLVLSLKRLARSSQ